MKIDLSPDGEILVLRVTGNLSFADNKEWRDISEQALAKDNSTLLLDVENLEMIDSAGLGMILTLKQWVEEKGKVLQLRYNPGNTVGSLIKLAKFDQMILDAR